MIGAYFVFSLFVAVGISAIITAIYIRSIIKTPAMIFTAMMFYEWISKQWSVIYLEMNHEHMNESGTVSEYIGASWRFALYNILAFWTASLVCRLLVKMFDRSAMGRRDETMEETWVQPEPASIMAAALILIGILGLEYLNFGLSSALPLPGSVATRHNYWEQYARFGWLPILFGKLIVFAPLVSAIVLFTRPTLTNKNLFLGIFLAYCAYLVISGQRFHGFLPAANTGVGIYAAHRILRGQSLISRGVIAGGIVLIAILMVYATIEMGQRKLSTLAGGAEKALVYRILVIQGGAYWNADAHVMTHGPSYRYYDMMDGMNTILLTIATKHTYETYRLAGVNLAAGLPTLTVIVCGYWLSALLMIAYGVIMGLSAFLVFWSARSGSILLAFPISYLWVWTDIVYSHASLESIISPKFFAFLLLTVGAFLYTEFRRR